jgi:tRNA-dihydrouridine synthase 1
MPSGADAMATASGDDGATRDVLKQSWYHRLGSPKHILAPMVDQSECAFRVLCRNHGCDLAYSPMYSSKQFAESELYRKSMINHFDGDAALGDRPLVIQFAGNDPQVLLEAAKHVQHRCNAVDLNLGCPQKIARRGHYGAWYCMPPSNAQQSARAAWSICDGAYRFLTPDCSHGRLAEETKLLQEIVGTLRNHLECPITVKIRVQEAGRSATLNYARMLQDAGASVVAVHGRTREQRGALQGAPSWEEIAAVKQALSVPVLANGGIFSRSDVDRCMAATGADGVLVGEALLENPALFEGHRCGDRHTALCKEYLALQAVCPADLRSVKQHLFNILYADVQVHTDLRERLYKARTLEDMAGVVEECERRPSAKRFPFSTERGDAYTCWYRRHAWEAQRHEAKQAQQAAAAAALAEAQAASGEGSHGGLSAAPPVSVL